MTVGGLRVVLAAAALPVALGLVGASFLATDGQADIEEAMLAPPPPKKAMLATVFEHTRVAPADLMLGHQLRMLSSSRKSVEQVAVINAKVPGEGRGGTVQDPILAQMQRSYGTTGTVKVVELATSQADLVDMMKKVFSVDQGSTTVFAKQFFSQKLTDDKMKRQMTYFTAMLHFFDLCSKAEFGVDICINMENEAFLYRKEKKGLLELASDLFDNDEDAVALQPPTYCDYLQAKHRPSWAKANKWTNSSFTRCLANATKARPSDEPTMLFNRERLMSILPLSVSKDELMSGFRSAFAAGLSRARAGAIKGMQCGHTFVIHSATERSQCKGKQMALHRQAHANAVGKMDKGNVVVPGEYELFDQMIVKGIEEMASRLESGNLPPALNNVGYKCQDMCPNRDRIIKEGTAW